MSLGTAKRNFNAFHRRGVDRQWSADWAPPSELWCIGRGVTLYYSSDKADPDDPTDTAGETWRGYYHDHESRETMVYLPSKQAIEFVVRPYRGKIIRPRWPEVIYWLGSADAFDYASEHQGILTVELNGTTERGGRKLQGMQLWAFPDGDHLVAVACKPGQNAQCIVWHGPELTVGWAGVDG